MKVTNKKGQGVVEMALVLPIFLIVVIGIFDFGRALHCWSTLNYQCVQAARAATKRIYPLIARNVFDAWTHPKIQDVEAAFWKNRSPMMPQDDYVGPVFTGVGDTSQTVKVDASFNLSLYTPLLGGLVGGATGSESGAVKINASAQEVKE